ncbi:hypothetical protein [uncultured Dokdonia sp.]|uniref:hypothetical protein n=1 Tax=uncultured Dokdonia sp. TaxID=575653 RepID=UPI00262E3808|nr:hypothetical protein [uncultured Dokdonia sp.]
MTSLLVIFYQDQKERMVYWWMFLIGAIGFSVLHIVEVGWLQFGIHSAFNIGMVGCMLLLLVGYVKLRFQTFDLQSVFGLGDMLFLIALSLGFTTVSFITLLVFGLLFSLLLHFVLKKMKSKVTIQNSEYTLLRQAQYDISRTSLPRRQEPTQNELKHSRDTIPLAGYLALFFAGVLLVHWLGFYDELYLM